MDFSIFFYFFLDDDCNCNKAGTNNETLGCDDNGACHCRCSIGGLKCDQCLDYHFKFPDCEENCKYLKKSISRFLKFLIQSSIDCACDPDGSTSLVCDKSDGQCPCKANVTGRRCNVCEDGFKNYPNCTSM